MHLLSWTLLGASPLSGSVLVDASAAPSAADPMEVAKFAVAAAALLISVASFIISRRADARAKRAEAIKSLLGEKESVAFAALKLLRDGLPENDSERQLVIAALMQACVFEGSDRARALLYRAIEAQRTKHREEFRRALKAIEDTFTNMRGYGFAKDELDLSRGERRVAAVKKVIEAS